MPLLRRRLVRDLATSYVATFVRAGAMFAMVAIVSHRTTPAYLAAFLFLRSVLGILTNLFAGVAPAAMAGMRPRPLVTAQVLAAPAGQEPTEAQDETPPQPTSTASGKPTLAYESRIERRAAIQTDGFDALFFASLIPAIIVFAAVCLCVPPLRDALALVLPPSRDWTVAAFSTSLAAGLLLRLHSDAAGGVMQTRGLLWFDNLLVSTAEILWVLYTIEYNTHIWRDIFVQVGHAHLTSGFLLWGARWLVAAALLVDWRRYAFCLRFDVARRFLAIAGMLAIASLGDFLYGGANNLIINRLLDPLLAADYNPALQVDALLLLAVAAISGVMLPRVVMLHEARDFAAIRKAYLASTAVGLLLLAGGAGLFLTFQGPLLRLWLGHDAPAGVAMILPWVLAHTVLGGTGSVGRAVMLGIGRFRAYTFFALGGGILNVLLGLTFVLGFGLDLRGLVMATILSVSIRVLIVMPWFILRTLRHETATHGLAAGPAKR